MEPSLLVETFIGANYLHTYTFISRNKNHSYERDLEESQTDFFFLNLSSYNLGVVGWSDGAG